MIAFQNIIRSEMHQNNILFIFKKIIFDIKTLKRSKNLKKNLKKIDEMHSKVRLNKLYSV